MTKKQIKSEAANKLARMLLTAGKTTRWTLDAMKLLSTVKNGIEPDEIFLEIEEDRK